MIYLLYTYIINVQIVLTKLRLTQLGVNFKSIWTVQTCVQCDTNPRKLHGVVKRLKLTSKFRILNERAQFTTWTSICRGRAWFNVQLSRVRRKSCDYVSSRNLNCLGPPSPGLGVGYAAIKQSTQIDEMGIGRYTFGMCIVRSALSQCDTTAEAYTMQRWM